MPLTSAQIVSIRHYLGYDTRMLNTDPAQYYVQSAIEYLNDPSKTADLALVTNPITGTPPGLLARLYDIETKLLSAHNRIKALQVGSIKLQPREIAMLRSEGRRAVNGLSTLIGVPVARDVFSDLGGAASRSNWVGK